MPRSFLVKSLPPTSAGLAGTPSPSAASETTVTSSAGSTDGLTVAVVRVDDGLAGVAGDEVGVFDATAGAVGDCAQTGATDVKRAKVVVIIPKRTNRILPPTRGNEILMQSERRCEPLRSGPQPARCVV